MAKEPQPRISPVAGRWYRAPDIPMAVIRRFARQIAVDFKPQRMILFGSFAYGKPQADSDVDLLVVMPTANEINQAVRICLEVASPFPLDLIVRTPETLRWRLEAGDWFLREVVGRGKVLYEQTDGGLGSQGRSRRGRGKKPCPD